MKAIFVSDAKETLWNVYAPDVRKRLARRVMTDGIAYDKNDLLATPDAFFLDRNENIKTSIRMI